jgi:nitroreductase
MDVLTAIHTRRSIRRYTKEPVAPEMIHTLLDAAMIAPSAGTAQPWQFVVIDDPALLAKAPGINPYAAMAVDAPLGILVCGDLSAEKFPGYWVQDCSAAVQNLMLAATGLGLGSVWTGIYPMEDRVEGFRQLCGLPQHIVPLGLVVVGHPDMRAESKSRYSAAKVRHNVWTSMWK